MIQPTVQLRGNGTVGSAVVVYSAPFAEGASPERYCNLALTAFHVVAEVLGNRLDREIDAVKLFFPGVDQETGALTARLIAYDKAKDIALLSLGTEMRLPGFAHLQDDALLEDLDIFSQACAVGCPLGSNPVATMGQITAVDKEVDGEKFWMINAPTYFGNSGGGVYSVPDCNLIGIFSKIALAEQKSRSTCSCNLNTRPLYARMPSNTPSPYNSPWSNTETAAFFSSTNLPLIKTFIGRRRLAASAVAGQSFSLSACHPPNAPLAAPPTPQFRHALPPVR